MFKFTMKQLAAIKTEGYNEAKEVYAFVMSEYRLNGGNDWVYEFDGCPTKAEIKYELNEMLNPSNGNTITEVYLEINYKGADTMAEFRDYCVDPIGGAEKEMRVF